MYNQIWTSTNWGEKKNSMKPFYKFFNEFQENSKWPQLYEIIFTTFLSIYWGIVGIVTYDQHY